MIIFRGQYYKSSVVHYSVIGDGILYMRVCIHVNLRWTEYATVYVIQSVEFESVVYVSDVHSALYLRTETPK